MTVVRGLTAKANNLPELLSQLKSQCGAGGKLGDDTLEIYGKHSNASRIA